MLIGISTYLFFTNANKFSIAHIYSPFLSFSGLLTTSNLETLGTNKLNTDNHISKVVLNANNNGVTFTIDGVPYTSPIMVAGKSITRMEIDTTLSKLTLVFFYDGQIIKRYVSLSAS